MNGAVAFQARASFQQAQKVNILIQLGPVDQVIIAKHFVMIAFRRGAMYQSREPGEWAGQYATILQVDGQGTICDMNVVNPGRTTKEE